MYSLSYTCLLADVHSFRDVHIRYVMFVNTSIYFRQTDILALDLYTEFCSIKIKRKYFFSYLESFFRVTEIKKKEEKKTGLSSC